MGILKFFSATSIAFLQFSGPLLGFRFRQLGIKPGLQQSIRADKLIPLFQSDVKFLMLQSSGRTAQKQQKEIQVNFVRQFTMAVGMGGRGLYFERPVNPILTRGKDYVQHITTYPLRCRWSRLCTVLSSKKKRKIKHFIHLNLANRPQSFSSYHKYITYREFRPTTKKACSSYVMCVKLAFLR